MSGNLFWLDSYIFSKSLLASPEVVECYPLCQFLQTKLLVTFSCICSPDENLEKDIMTHRRVSSKMIYWFMGYFSNMFRYILKVLYMWCFPKYSYFSSKIFKIKYFPKYFYFFSWKKDICRKINKNGTNTLSSNRKKIYNKNFINTRWNIINTS